MSRETVCFCQNGLMSQCKAPSRPEMIACRFYEKSMVADRCMYFIEEINSHCDSHKAQMFGYCPPGSGNYEDEDELIIEDLIVDEVDVERNCVNCILYTCSHVIHENQQAQARGGLTMEDLCNIARACPDYEDEESMQAKINLSLRGVQP